jgi:hypothetical protein
LNDSAAIKVSYFDNQAGEMNLVYKSGRKEMREKINLKGDGNLKTATFFVANLVKNSLPHHFDFALEAGLETEKITISIVRVIDL